MNKYKMYVYLVISHELLIISANEINDANFMLLYDNEKNLYQECYEFCKVFCIGYIMGSVALIKPVNKIKDFE